MDKLIRELSLRLLNIISEQSQELGDLIKDPNYAEIIDESIEVVIDESLKNFDDYITSLEDVFDDEIV